MKVSVVTITYNRAQLIGETIRSVLDQTWADFEHIIIDDGSTDDTRQTVESFGDPRIRYYPYPKQQSRSYLRNEGVRKATGGLVSILDSDDIWMSDKLELVVSVFKRHPEAGMVVHDLGFSRNGSVFKSGFFPYPSGWADTFFKDLLAGRVLPFPVMTFRKTAIEEVGLFDETMIDGQHDLYTRIAVRFPVYHIDRQLTVMRKHEGNVSSRNDMRHYYDHLAMLRKLRRAASISGRDYSNLLARAYRKMGYLYRHDRQYAHAFRMYFKSFTSTLGSSYR